MQPPTHCTLCPRRCGANRARGPGRCGASATVRVARAAPHFGEEPCLSGTRGSGAVFFCGCALGCVFCQNAAISRGAAAGRTVTTAQLAALFLKLQRRGVHNLNLVTAGHHWPAVRAAVHAARKSGLALPVVWNTGGYEAPAAIAALNGTVNVWLADLKFYSPALAGALAGAPDYFAVASAALRQMCKAAGPPVLNAEGLLQSGVMVRLLVLPGHRQDAKQLLRWMAAALPKGGFMLSLMRQYTPPPGAALPRPLHRPLASYEYRDVVNTAVELGLTLGYTQGAGAVGPGFVPAFDGTGL